MEDKIREIKSISKGINTMDGAGVKLVRVFTGSSAREIDPFLMMDVFDSENYDDYKAGFPFHPHRGIETITYLFEGEIEHQDNLGHKEVIRPGDAQWMTSGVGIIHQEMPLKSKRLRGAQIWLNLPAKDKLAEAQYNTILKEDIRVLEDDGSIVRVIAGEYKGQKGFEGKFADAGYFDITVFKDKRWEFEIASDMNCFLYVFDGSIRVGETILSSKNAGILGRGNKVVLEGVEDENRFIFLYGKPLDEPIAFGGPVVMNSREEVEEAFRQLRDGSFLFGGKK